MKSTPFVLLFAATCAILGFTGLSVRHEAPAPVAPTKPPTTWPDYSARGPGFRVPQGPDGPMIAYGYDLLTRTYAIVGPEVAAPAMRFAGNNLSCQNCHLDGGTNRFAFPLVGVFGAFPRSLPGGGEMTLVDRLNRCMTHSMNGRPLPTDSREMQAMVAFLKYLGDVPPAPPQPPTPQPPLSPSAERGAVVFDKVCAACHQPNGLGKRLGASSQPEGYEFPPLWGPDTFNDAAGLDMAPRMTAFVLHNMPRGTDPLHPVLSLQQAWDVATYVLAQPRPRYAGP
ncbi:MAG: c-type cytochrome [Proteobacteria bacterium]|nr:c-type cytochrome [Pseudomonadota bacterium]